MISDNINEETIPRLPIKTEETERTGLLLLQSNIKSVDQGEVLDVTYIFNSAGIVYSTDRNFLICVDLFAKKQFHYLLSKAPATCLGFLPSEGFVICGLLNCSFVIMDPRNYQFKQTKKLNNLTSAPPIDLKIIQGGFRFLVLNSNGEFILATRAKLNSLKFNAVGIYKTDSKFPYLSVKALEFYDLQGAIAAIVSEECVKTFWIDFQETDRIRPLFQFCKPGTNLSSFSGLPSSNLLFKFLLFLISL